MAFTSTEKINQAAKLSQQIIDGSNDSPGAKWWYNAQRAWVPYAKPCWVSKDSIPGAADSTEADTAVTNNPTILEKKKIRLTLDVTSNNRQYECRDTYDDMTSDPVEDWIQPSTILDSGSASNGYIVRLYHGDPDSGGVEITTTYNSGSGGEPCWWFAYSSGIMFVSTDNSSAFKTFYDTNGLYLVGYRYIGAKVDEGGDRTISNLVMRVDPINGIVPPEGTIITNQDDYDALGGDIKYIADVLAILPGTISHIIQIYLAAGDHGFKPDGGVFTAHPLRGFDWHPVGGPGYTFSPEGYLCVAGNICFIGEGETEIESTQSGTFSNGGIISDSLFLTRDSGTWTVNEHQGKFVRVDSGANSGDVLVIMSNTATELTLGSGSDAGACTFSIVEPAAAIYQGTSFGSLSSARGAAPYRFFNIDFGDASTTAGRIDLRGGDIVFDYCRFFISGAGDPLTVTASAFVQIKHGVITATGGAYVSPKTGGELTIWGSLLIGPPNSVYGLAYLYQGGILDLWGYSRVIATSSTSYPIIVVEDGYIQTGYTDGGAVIGDGNNTGIQVDVSLNGDLRSLCIDNCATAINLRSGLTNIFEVGVIDLIAGGMSNTLGWKIANGVQSIIGNSADNISATTDIQIDGENETYSEFNTYKSIEGRYGSKITGA